MLLVMVTSPPVCVKHGCEKVRKKAGKKADGSQKWEWYCRECHAEYQRRNYPANAEARREYYRRRYEENAEASREQARRRRKENPEAYRERDRSYREANAETKREQDRRRRARKRQATVEKITPCDLALILVQQTWACAYCGADLLTTPKHLDHIIPLSRGGTHTLDNVIYACEACNLAKNAALPGEWRSAAVFLLVEEDVLILAA